MSDEQTTHPRVIEKTWVRGVFTVPIGIRLLSHEPGHQAKRILVSTVCLEGGHLEDPLRICSPEHGYETMVFLDGCSLFSVFTRKYETRAKAKRGHREVVEKLLAKEIPLSIPLGWYSAWDEEPADAAA